MLRVANNNTNVNNMQTMIKVGEPQPIKCNVCHDYCGYLISDDVQTKYKCVYNADGSFNNGRYSNLFFMKKRGFEVTCAKCGEPLDFKVFYGKKD